jgi:hypothetical protein
MLNAIYWQHFHVIFSFFRGIFFRFPSKREREQLIISAGGPAATAAERR